MHVLQDSTCGARLWRMKSEDNLMAEHERRRGGGGKLSRSETVTVRLDPKLRYLAELAARKQRRTLSSYIEWAIEDSLQRTTLHEDSNGQTTLADEASNLWDVDDADRFAKLALNYPHLLTHEEQVRWKLIRENGYLWRGHYGAPQGKGTWTWEVQESSLCFDRLRDKWDVFSRVATGEAPASELPTWSKHDPKHMSFEDMDDDIPF
jgi:hypothetical protein